MSEVVIPERAWELLTDFPRPEDIETAAALIAAAELDRLSGEYWNRNLVSVADLRHWLRDRATELRGEGEGQSR